MPSHWKLAKFDLYAVNPPLVRMLAALPVLFCPARTDWGWYNEQPSARAEFRLGKWFLNANGRASLRYFVAARWACIPLSLVGGFYCFRWARELYGKRAGAPALILWCFCPNVAGHAQLITPDAGAAALWLVAAYAFWHWLKRPNWARVALAGTALGVVPVPLPKHFLLGIDLQKYEFESKCWSYLGGEWKHGGWWYYYLYAMAIKLPLGTWLLIFLSVFVGLVRRGYAASWRDECFLLMPALAVLVLASSQTGFSHHLRYVLPAFPFAFVWMSKVARAVDLSHRKTAWMAALALAWTVASSTRVYPHGLSYFNELVGGPKGGPDHLAESNSDWGQDLLYLKAWLEKHPNARPLPQQKLIRGRKRAEGR
jgi:hypothetical protein